MQEFVISVDGMTCSHCENRVKKAILGVSGVSDAAIDLAAKTATAKADDSVTLPTIVAAITDAGYDVL